MFTFSPRQFTELNLAVAYESMESLAEWKSKTDFYDSCAPFAWRLPVFLQKLPAHLLVLLCWFQWLCTRVFLGIYAIPSSVHLSASLPHEVKLSMHRWWVCTLHLQYMYETKNVVSTCKVLYINLVLCWPAVSWGPGPSCNFTLYVTIITRVWILCEMICVISTSWNCWESKEELCLITNDGNVLHWLVVIFDHMNRKKAPPKHKQVASYWSPTQKASFWKRNSSKRTQEQQQNKHALTDPRTL